MRELSELSAHDWVVQLPIVLVLLATACELAWIAWADPARRAELGRSASTAGAMGAGALVIGTAYAALLGVIWSALRPVSLEWSAPPAVAAALTFVAWDLAGWAYHWLGHQTTIGWAAHQPHHTGPAYDLTLSLRQSWFPVHGLAVHPLLALAGFDLRTIAVCAALSNGWQALQHTAGRVALPRCFAQVVMTPAAHRHHHGSDAGARAAVNLGPVLTLWDRLAGTWVDPAVPAPSSYGPLDTEPRGALAIELAGWRTLARHRSRAAGSAGPRPRRGPMSQRDLDV